MAKKSSIVKNERRRQTVAKYAAQRAELLAQARDLSRSPRERFEARQKLALLPHDANPNRIRNRDGAHRAGPVATFATSDCRASPSGKWRWTACCPASGKASL